MSYSVCLFTVVYPAAEPYLERFFESVQQQEYSGFELLVLNDGVADLQQYTRGLEHAVHEVPVGGTIAEVRSKGIRLLMEQPLEKIIFADADDFLSPSRVGGAVRALKQYDIYVNDLTVVSGDGQVLQDRYLSQRLRDGYEISREFILQKNIMGLGNTSVRKTALRDLPLPKSAVAVDWILFTDMLQRECSAVFRNDSVTYYRRHDNNSACFRNLTPESLRRALKVQLQNAACFAPESVPHARLLEQLNKLRSFFAEDEGNVTTYANRVEKHLPAHPFWWEDIQPNLFLKSYANH